MVKSNQKASCGAEQSPLGASVKAVSMWMEILTSYCVGAGNPCKINILQCMFWTSVMMNNETIS